jgi:hypothetical protein
MKRIKKQVYEVHACTYSLSRRCIISCLSSLYSDPISEARPTEISLQNISYATCVRDAHDYILSPLHMQETLGKLKYVGCGQYVFFNFF